MTTGLRLVVVILSCALLTSVFFQCSFVGSEGAPRGSAATSGLAADSGSLVGSAGLAAINGFSEAKTPIESKTGSEGALRASAATSGLAADKGSFVGSEGALRGSAATSGLAAINGFSEAKTSIESKTNCEIGYWRGRHKSENQEMTNKHYLEWGIYTSIWDITLDWYTGKHMLDIGCGPRGSLEHFGVAASRTCAEPLAKLYGQDFSVGRKHNMRYVNCGVEDMPFPDESFDTVSTINNFDHVANPAKGVREIFRVIRPGGSLMMLVEIHPPKPPCEPQKLPKNLSSIFVGLGMDVEKEFLADTVGIRVGTQAVVDNKRYDPKNPPNHAYWLCFHLVKHGRWAGSR